jgi:hypothetical protein
MPAKDVPPTRAWLLMGLTGSAPGVLQVVYGRLIYAVHGRGALTDGQLRRLEDKVGRPGLADELDDGARIILLDVPLDEVGRVSFPWYYFGGGMRLGVDGVRFRFSFVRPQNTHEVPGIMAVPATRATGRSWQAALAPAS